MWSCALLCWAWFGICQTAVLVKLHLSEDGFPSKEFPDSLGAILHMQTDRLMLLAFQTIFCKKIPWKE